MNTAEAKAQIVAGLQQNSINALVEKLAEVLVENDTLKARVAELELAAKPKAKVA